VKKGLSNSDKEKLVYDKATKNLFITRESSCCSDDVLVIGEIVEERFNG
jgi:hypothetical protein